MLGVIQILAIIVNVFISSISTTILVVPSRGSVRKASKGNEVVERDEEYTDKKGEAQSKSCMLPE